MSQKRSTIIPSGSPEDTTISEDFTISLNSGYSSKECLRIIIVKTWEETVIFNFVYN